jgi:hypothetical protein
MRNKIASALFLAFASLCFGSEARACGCVTSFAQYQPCSAYWNAGVVFTGTVSEIGPMIPVDGSDRQLFTFNGRFTRFTIEDAFRGVTGETVEIFDHGTSCDYSFQLGERYFIYGGRDPKDSKIYVSACSATKTINRASDDLSYARGVKRNEPTPGIIGLVNRETRDRADQYRKNTPLEGIRVIASEDTKSAEAFTDANGIFRFFGLAPGSYYVRALTPPDLRRLYGDEVLKLKVTDGRCSGGQFSVTSLSLISGKVLDSDGEPVKTRLNLVPIDTAGAQITPAEGSIETYSDAQGQYKFDWLAPGNYLVAINGRDQPGASDPPYPKSYLPGVIDRKRATIISVTEGQEVAVPDFQLPSPLIARTIQGVVTLPDGTPVPHALVWLEFTAREWVEVNSTDAQGHFALKVYEGFKYLVAGEVRKEIQGVWRATHSTSVEVIGGQAIDTITFVVSQPGFYVPRYVERTKKQR